MESLNLEELHALLQLCSAAGLATFRWRTSSGGEIEFSFEQSTQDEEPCGDPDCPDCVAPSEPEKN